MLAIKYSMYKNKILKGNLDIIFKMKNKENMYNLTEYQLIDLISTLYSIENSESYIDDILSNLDGHQKVNYVLDLVFKNNNFINDFLNNDMFRKRVVNDIYKYKKENIKDLFIELSLNVLLNELLDNKEWFNSCDEQTKEEIKSFVLNIGSIDLIKKIDNIEKFGYNAFEKILNQEEMFKEDFYNLFINNIQYIATKDQIKLAYSIFENLNHDLKQKFLNRLSNNFVMTICDYYEFIDKDEKLVNNLFLAFESGYLQILKPNQVRITRYLKDVEKTRGLFYEALKSNNFSKFYYNIEIELEKEKILEKQMKEERSNWDSLIMVNDQSYSSYVSYNEPNTLQSQYFDMTVAPTMNNELTNSKSGRDLDFVIKLLLDAAQRYNFNLENEQILNEYRTSNIFDEGWNRPSLEEERKIRKEIVEEVSKSYILLYDHIITTNQNFDYTYRSYYNSEYYDNSYSSTTIVSNVITTLKEAIKKAILYTKGENYSNEFERMIETLYLSKEKLQGVQDYSAKSK